MLPPRAGVCGPHMGPSTCVGCLHGGSAHSSVAVLGCTSLTVLCSVCIGPTSTGACCGFCSTLVSTTSSLLPCTAVAVPSMPVARMSTLIGAAAIVVLLCSSRGAAQLLLAIPAMVPVPWALLLLLQQHVPPDGLAPLGYAGLAQSFWPHWTPQHGPVVCS